MTAVLSSLGDGYLYTSATVDERAMTTATLSAPNLTVSRVALRPDERQRLADILRQLADELDALGEDK